MAEPAVTASIAPRDPVLEPSPALSTTSNIREQNETIIQNAQDTLTQFVYSFIYWFQAITMFAFISECVVVLTLCWSDACDQPLASFLLFFAINTFISLTTHIYYYKELISGLDVRETGWRQRLIRSLRDTAEFTDRLLLLMGVILTSSVKTYPQTSRPLYYVAIQIVICKLVILFGPILFFILLFCCFGTILALLSRYQKWKNKAKFNRLIGKIPIYKYSTTKPDGKYGEAFITVANADCAICLTSYEDLVDLRILPCNHHFHSDCIDQWICISPSCPLCKRPVFPDEENLVSTDPSGAGVGAADLV